MARKPGRYTEARLYMVSGALAAMMMVWAALAVRDIPSSPAAPVTPATTTNDTVTGATQPTPQPQRQSQSQRRSSAQVVPHTRTKAS